MKRALLTSLSLVVASTLVLQAGGTGGIEDKLASLESEIAKLKKQLKKQKKTLNKVKAHGAGDNIKWSADLRTSLDNLNYDMADGSERKKDALWAMRLWLNGAYAPDAQNVFKMQLAMNKAFGADFGGYDPNNPMYNRTFSMGGMFDWVGNEALTDNHLKVREAYWLYLGESLFGTNIPWTFSLGRRPSTNGFLASLREDDEPKSPLGHIINVEFDGLSSKFDLSNVTGVPGMSFKVCMGQGSTNAKPLFDMSGTSYDEAGNALKDIKLAGFIFEPYNDGQYIVKTTWYKAWDLPGMDGTPILDTTDPTNPSLVGIQPSSFRQYGNMYGAAISVLVDGIGEDGILADTKLFGSYAWSKTDPNAGMSMLGSSESETGTSYWVGAQVPVVEKGKLGIEYNKGDKYWRPFTYGEDTMIGSKLAARGDAFEAYFTYQLTDALSAQIRYTNITYDYTGSNGFFGNFSGTPSKIEDMKNAANQFVALGGTVDANGAHNIGVVAGQLIAGGMDPAKAQQTAGEMAGAALFLPNVVEKAQDLRFYLRYRF